VKRKSSPILAVSDLRVARGSTHILRGVSWEVKPGEHWVILGPNGCGKTSLLRALTGYLPPTTGRLAVFGRVYGEADWRDLRTRIGLVTSALQMSIPFAEPAIETVISGKFAQLDLWARIARADETEAVRLLRLVGAARLAQREWGHLSQGERQRVLIARALMARPELLILDEPCAGLDPIARAHFLTFVHRLARLRRCPSLVLVTHHVEEVTPTFTHALLLRAGKVLAAGPKAATLNSHNLSRTFGASVRLIRRGGEYRLCLPRAELKSRAL
jgi:iron complex transport system ATP-binding protein